MKGSKGAVAEFAKWMVESITENISGTTFKGIVEKHKKKFQKKNV